MNTFIGIWLIVILAVAVAIGAREARETGEVFIGCLLGFLSLLLGFIASAVLIAALGLIFGWF